MYVAAAAVGGVAVAAAVASSDMVVVADYTCLIRFDAKHWVPQCSTYLQVWCDKLIVSDAACWYVKYDGRFQLELLESWTCQDSRMPYLSVKRAQRYVGAVNALCWDLGGRQAGFSALSAVSVLAR